MIFLWPAAAQQAIVTLAGPTQLSLPSTVLLTPGHHVLCGFSFWNAGSAPVNVDIFTDASCQRFSRRLSVTIPAQSGQLGGPPVFQQSHYFNLEIGEGVYIVPSADAVITCQADGYI